MPVIVDVADGEGAGDADGGQGDGFGAGGEDAIGIPEEPDAIGVEDEEIVPGAAVDIDGGDGAVEVVGEIAEGGGGLVGETDGDAGGIGLFEGGRGAGLGMDAAFVDGGIVGGDGASGGDLLMGGEGQGGGFALAQAEEHLGQLIVGGGMIGLELGDFGELFGGVLEMSPTGVGKTELEADGVDGAVDVLGDLEGLDGVGVLVLSEEGAAEEVMAGGGVGFEMNDFAGVDGSLGGLIGDEVGVGEVQVDVGIGRVHGPGLLEEFGGAGGVAFFEIGPA